MRALLDTHVFLWLNAAPERAASHLDLFAQPETELFVSVASTWEIAIKAGLGKFDLPETVDRFVPERCRRIGATLLPIEHAHAARVESLPPIHRDPFDRLLVAQAVAIDATLFTADATLARYPAPVVLVTG